MICAHKRLYRRIFVINGYADIKMLKWSELDSIEREKERSKDREGSYRIYQNDCHRCQREKPTWCTLNDNCELGYRHDNGCKGEDLHFCNCPNCPNNN